VPPYRRKTIQRAALFFLLFAPLANISSDPGSNLDASLTTKSHHDGQVFRNPYAEHRTTRFFTYVRMRFFSDEKFADYTGQGHRVPRAKIDLKRIQHPDAGEPQMTWIGHSTVLLQYQGINILTDPILSQRASPVSFVGPKRVTPAALRPEQLPVIHFVVISHNHYDHLDRSTVAHIGNNAQWLVPLRLGKWFREQGIDPQRVHELDWWSEQNFGDVFFAATPAQHFSGRTLWDSMETLWSSWVIRIGEFSVWFGGDTGYNATQFKQIGRRYGPFDLGLIPIGAYQPRWFMRPVHVDPTEAVLLHQDVLARQSVGIHWGTFPLAAEEIDAPAKELRHAVRAANLSARAFGTVPIGKTLDLKMLDPKVVQAPHLTAVPQGD